MNRDNLNPEIGNRILVLALVIGVMGTAAAIAGLFAAGSQRFFQAYLFAYLFWLGLTLGSMGILLLHNVTGGHWGFVIRPILEANASTIWLMALLFIPILLVLPLIYPWAQSPVQTAGNPLLQFKANYLSPPFFIARAVAYFVIWGLLVYLANRWYTGREEKGSRPALGRLRALGSIGVILYFLTMSFAVVDWLMSIEPQWISTIYGMLMIIGQSLGAFSFTLLVLPFMPWFQSPPSINRMAPRTPFRDLGSLLLTLVVLWAYLSASQLIITWQGNLPRDAAWYLARTGGGWGALIAVIVILQFVFPFLVLLFWRVRWDPRILAAISALLVIVNMLYNFWQVMPAFYPGAFTLHWVDLALVIGMGGLWVAAFLFALRRRPAGPLVQEAVAAEL